MIDGVTIPRREFVFASESLWHLYHQRMSAISREWAVRRLEPDENPDEAFHCARVMREVERKQLAADVRRLVAEGFSGPYPIPIPV